MHDPARLIGNIVALIAVALGLAYLLDQALAWFGYGRFALCGILGFVQITFGHTLGLVMAFIGFVMWVFSRFQSPPALTLFLGGLFVGIAPQLFLHYLNVSCATSIY